MTCSSVGSKRSKRSSPLSLVPAPKRVDTHSPKNMDNIEIQKRLATIISVASHPPPNANVHSRGSGASILNGVHCHEAGFQFPALDHPCRRRACATFRSAEVDRV